MMMFFYGTLKRAGYNFNRFGEQGTFLGEGKVQGFTLVSVRGMYPAAIKAEGREVQGELFDVPAHIAMRIERMERGAGYREAQVLVELPEGRGTMATMYYYPDDMGLQSIGAVWDCKEREQWRAIA